MNSEWNTGNGSWNVPTNWFPNDVPDNGGGITYDVEIGNRAVATNALVTFVPEDGTSDSILSLAMSGGADLLTNGFQVFVSGQTTVTVVGSSIRVDPHATPGTIAFDTDNLDITGGAIQMRGGLLNVDVLMEINSTGVVQGFGTVNVGDFDVAVATVLENSGLIQLSGGIASPGTLTLETNGVDTLDLDGTTETGVIDVSNVAADAVADSNTLIVDGPLSDAFGGTLQIGQRDTVTFNNNFTMEGADLQLAGGSFTATMNGPAAITNIQNSAFTITSDAVIGNNMTFAGAGNSVTVNAASSLTFDGTVSMSPGTLNLAALDSELIVGGSLSMLFVGEDLNWDGPGTATTTVKGTGAVSFTVDQIDTTDNVYGGTLNLNDNGDAAINVTATSWTLAGTLNKNDAGTSILSGDRVVVTGSVNANAGTLDMPATTLSAGSDVAVAGLLTLGGNSELAGPSTLNGAGTLRMEGASTVTASTTVDVGNFDYDGLGTGTLHTINNGVVFTINSPVLDSDGDMDDPITLQGTGSSLIVNGPTEWTMNGPLNSNPASATTAVVDGTSRVIFGDAINANSGTTSISAPATLGATAAATVAAGALLNFGDPVTFAGGVVTGNGSLRISSTSQVNANTSISVQTVDWDGMGIGSSHLINDGATLDISCTVFDDDGGMNDPLTIRGGGGTLSVSGPASWDMLGSLTTNPTDTGLATVGGTSRMILTSASGILNANGDTTISAPVTLGTASTTNVAAAALLTLAGANTTFAGGSVAGAGILRVGSTSSVTANSTIAVNTFDWDGTGAGSLHTINDSVAFTINSPNFDNDGIMNDPITILSGGSLAVNGPASWDMVRTLTANPTAVGTATVAGTSRMVLSSVNGLFNVLGDTTVSAPITFDAGSITTVAAGARLTVSGDAIYDGGSITGAGYYSPPAGDRNTVVEDSTISTTDFNFDGGNWVVNAGKRLTVNVGDYDPDASVNGFGTTLTLNSGSADVNTADPVFVMEGRLNMNTAPGTFAGWLGDAIQIGNDTGTLDADLNITGTGFNQIGPDIDFKSDADVFIDAGATLQLLGNASFNSVNGANNAEFTGGGRLQTSRQVSFNEATTLNMVGGSVDLDGADAIGETIFVKAPVVINVATMSSFGVVNGGGGTNTLDVNNSAGTGSLAVNLDSPAAEWTLNAPGVMNLVNDNTAATLLAGSDVNLNGTLNVVGDVRTTARIDLGPTAVLNILTSSEPLRLAGGNNVITPGLADPNTIAGGVINGPGLLGADTTAALQGFGTINAGIDFDGSGNLWADDGILTLNGAILDAFNIGTADADGILNIPATWNSGAVTFVSLLGGELRGGTVTLDNAQGLTGSGLVSARVINNSRINAGPAAATLIVETAGNENDWDGAAGVGVLSTSGGILELRDNALFGFTGNVTATDGGRVFTNNFALDFNPGSSINLTGSTFESTHSTDIRGAVTVGSGADSTIEIQNVRSLDFEGTSTTTLTGNLRLVTSNGLIRAGATFGGAGAFKIAVGSLVSPENSANINVLLDNSGQLRLAGFGTGRVDAKDFQQSASGDLEIDLYGTAPADYDQLVIGGTAQIDGDLVVKFGFGYVPALGDAFNILSATGGVIGTFDPMVQPIGMPSGLVFEVTYLPTLVQLKVVSATPFDAWINTFGIANSADRTKAANPDGDALNNFAEFGLDGDPTSSAASGKIVGKIATVGGSDALTLTFPVRNGTVADPADPAGGELGLKQTADGLFYKIQASDELGAWTLPVTDVTGPEAAAIQLGLPALTPGGGWIYRTFRSPGSVVGDPLEFIRVGVAD